MQSRSPLLDDLARMANGAAGVFTGLRHEIEGVVHQRIDRFLAEADLVRREEFEVVEAMAAKARQEQEALAARVAELEARLAEAKPAQAPVRRAKKADDGA